MQLRGQQSELGGGTLTFPAPAALVPAGTAPRWIFESDVGTGAARQPLAEFTEFTGISRKYYFRSRARGN